MRPTKAPLTSSQKNALKSLAITSAVLVSFIAGMALNRALDDELRTPFLLEKVYADAQEDLIDRSVSVFRDDDLARLSFISGLRQTGVAKAYNVEIETLRANAFEPTRESKNVVAISSIDTRMADRLLLDAIPNLGDDDLYQVLRENRQIFLTEARVSMLRDTDATNNDQRYSNLFRSHSTLSEKERDQLSACLKILEDKLGKQEHKALMFENGSGSCMPAVEPKKVDLFSPRRFLKYQ
jgi:hypothetical protein